jgi:hypothetical protein
MYETAAGLLRSNIIFCNEQDRTPYDPLDSAKKAYPIFFMMTVLSIHAKMPLEPSIKLISHSRHEEKQLVLYQPACQWPPSSVESMR